MRTTITLDPDVAALVQKRMRDRRVGFKDAVNGALREALTQRSHASAAHTRSVSLGTPSFPVEHALRIAGELEDEEILRKVRVGK